MYDAMVSVLPSSVVRVCLCMIQLSREEGLDPISYATQSVAFLTSLTLGREFPLTYGLDCFATTGIGTVYPSGAPEFIPGLMWGSCSSIFSFVCMVCRSFFVLLSFFPLDTVSSVLLRFTDSDSLFGIFKLFLFRDFKSRLSFLISVGRIEHYC